MNFNTLVTAIQNELNDFGPRTSTRIVQWVNEGHKFICQSRRWNFLRVRYSDEITIAPAGFPFDIEASIKVATVVTAAKSIQQIWDVSDGVYTPLAQTTAEQMRDSFYTDYSQSDSPTLWYYVTGKTIKVFPETSDNRKLIFSFEKKIPDYAAGATTALLIPDEYVDVLKNYVLFKAYLYKNDQRSQLFSSAYQSLLKTMVEAEANKAGIIYDDKFFDDRFGGYVPMSIRAESISDSIDFTIVTAGVEVAIAHNLGVIPSEVLPVVKTGKLSFANVYAGTTPWTETHAYLTASLAGDYSACFRIP